MHKYEVIIYWSEEDQVFIAEVPELSGCMAHGSSQEEALASANQAIQLWIDTAREFGRPVPEPKGHGSCLPSRMLKKSASLSCSFGLSFYLVEPDQPSLVPPVPSQLHKEVVGDCLGIWYSARRLNEIAWKPGKGRVARGEREDIPSGYPLASRPVPLA